MATLNDYREAVRAVLKPYAEARYDNVEASNRLICDEKNDQYLILSLGWAKRPKRRIHGCLIHIEIIDNKIWIQRDGTEDGIAGELEEAGVAKTAIVLGFHEPRIRCHTEYAAA